MGINEKSEIVDKCKDCKHFDNTKPVSTSRENDKYKFAEPYIGECKKIGRIMMMNDTCGCFKKHE